MDVVTRANDHEDLSADIQIGRILVNRQNACIHKDIVLKSISTPRGNLANLLEKIEK